MMARRYALQDKTDFSTNVLISGSTDSELMSHMGVPLKVQGTVLKLSGEQTYPEAVQGWIGDLPYIFRPQPELQIEVPEMCGTGLLLYGKGGAGKTTLASRLLLDLVRMGVKNTDPTRRNFTWHGWAMGRFFDWQDVSEMLRLASRSDDDEEGAQEVLRSLKVMGPMESRADFAVLDDISRERRTEFNTGELHRILRRRNADGLVTIVTTNHEPDEWSEVYGDVLAKFLRRSFIPVLIEREH